MAAVSFCHVGSLLESLEEEAGDGGEIGAVQNRRGCCFEGGLEICRRFELW